MFSMDPNLRTIRVLRIKVQRVLSLGKKTFEGGFELSFWSKHIYPLLYFGRILIKDYC